MFQTISQKSQESSYVDGFFNTVDGIKPATQLKERPRKMRISVSFIKFLRVPI